LTSSDILERLRPGDGVVVIRLRSLGDCVLSTPALHLLKAYRPDLRLAVVAEDRFGEIFKGNPEIEAVLAPRAAEIRGFRPALCLNLHGGTRSARLTLLSGARFRAGFDIFRPGWIYNTPIPTAQEILRVNRAVHTAEHAASAMFYLGVPISEAPRAFVPTPSGRSPLAPSSPYAVIHPFAATAEKTWPARSFLELARFVSQSLGLEPVFIGAESDDVSALSGWRTIVGASLAEIARLMRDAALFIGNDSGPAHVAAAFGVPEVVLFGPSSLETWAPWRTPAEAIKAGGPIASLPVSRVIGAIEKLQARTRVKDAV
jgi:ADP-heptose:LPS heptosyltransferase